MKKLILALAALSAMAVCVPAQASKSFGCPAGTHPIMSDGVKVCVPNH